MKNMFKWFLMLNKRLYKKFAFIVIVLLIPVCVCAFGFASKQTGGFVKVVLAQTNNNDKLTNQIIEELMADNTLIHFIKESNPEKAIQAVKSGRADTAWIFPDDMQSNINEFSAHNSNKEPFISVVERKQTVFTRLAREKLTSCIYKYNARALFIDFATRSVPQLDNLSQEEIVDYFDKIAISDQLFEFSKLGDFQGESSQKNYLTLPVRGLLSVVAVICSFAAAMFCIQDEANGTFSWVKEKRRTLINFLCILTAVLNVGATMFVSLFVSRLGTSFFREFLGIIMLSVSCSMFALLLKQIFTNIKLYGALLPLLVSVMIGLCPIFFELKELRFISHLLPSTYYIYSAYNSNYFIYGMVYILITALLCFVLNNLMKLKKTGLG